jgi:hypothetical protein
LHRKIIALFITYIFCQSVVWGQHVEPSGTFLNHHVKIGEEVDFALSVKYAKELNILFPDSLFNFGTFEYNSRIYYKTQTDSIHSFDSVVYNLSTFEVDSVQYLQLPVFILNNEDSVAIYSNVDSVQLIHVVTEIPENPELIANTDMVRISRQFNYPYVLVGLGIVFFLALTVALFFGKRLVKAWKVYRLNRTHKKFVARFFNLMRDVSSNNPVSTTEHVLAVWKRYMERLERKPISKLTTKEILVLHNNGQLKENLRLIDRSIYGGEKGNDLFASFDYLMKFSIEIYKQRISEIKKS